MKRIITSILVILVLCFAIFTLTGCGKNEESSKEKEEPTIVGSWEYSGGNYKYTFKKDGTGSYDVYGSEMKFTYEIDGNKISILYDGNTDPFETEYEIDGDTLNIIDSFGSDTLYERVK